MALAAEQQQAAQQHRPTPPPSTEPDQKQQQEDVWSSTLVAEPSDDHQPVEKSLVVPGDERAFVLRHVLSPSECAAMLRTAEGVGWGASPSDNKAYRNHAYLRTRSSALSAKLWPRIAPHLGVAVSQVVLAAEDDAAPHFGFDSAGEWHASDLGDQWRFLRYGAGGHFGPHYDACVQRDGNARSFYTCLVYLDGGCEGGATLFLDEHGADMQLLDTGFCAPASMVRAEVRPEAGMCLLFWHKLMHEGQTVTGALPKTMMRADLFFTRDPATDPSLHRTPEEARFFQNLERAMKAEQAGDVSEAMARYRTAERACPRLWHQHRL